MKRLFPFLFAVVGTSIALGVRYLVAHQGRPLTSARTRGRRIFDSVPEVPVQEVAVSA